MDHRNLDDPVSEEVYRAMGKRAVLGCVRLMALPVETPSALVTWCLKSRARTQAGGSGHTPSPGSLFYQLFSGGNKHPPCGISWERLGPLVGVFLGQLGCWPPSSE